METKRCARCRITKPTTEFGSDRSNPDGLHLYCRVCINAYMNARYVKRPKREKPPLPELKRCSQCGEEKPRSQFRKAAKGNRAADRLFAWCRPCVNEYQRRRRNDPKFRRKYLIRMFTGIAAQLGIITRQPCEICGDPKVVAHHTDYAQPLEVRWLCKPHHLSHGHAGAFSNPPQ